MGETKNTIENSTLQGTNTLVGTVMVGGIVGGGFCTIKNSSATADITLTADDIPELGMTGILVGGLEDGSIIGCTVTGGSITVPGGSIGIGGLAASAQAAAEVKNCAVNNVTITVGENCFMIGGLLGYTGTYSPDTPTVINNCTINVTISAPVSAERIGGIVGSGFYSSEYATMASMPGYEFLGAPGAFKITKSSTSGSITGGCTDLVGKIAGYIYDNSTVGGTCIVVLLYNTEYICYTITHGIRCSIQKACNCI
jgi:hypothetical protein